MVEHKKSKQLYALKYIDKAKCIKQKAIANIVQERRLLEEVSSSSCGLSSLFWPRGCVPSSFSPYSMCPTPLPLKTELAIRQCRVLSLPLHATLSDTHPRRFLLSA